MYLWVEQLIIWTAIAIVLGDMVVCDEEKLVVEKFLSMWDCVQIQYNINFPRNYLIK